VWQKGGARRRVTGADIPANYLGAGFKLDGALFGKNVGALP